MLNSIVLKLQVSYSLDKCQSSYYSVSYEATTLKIHHDTRMHTQEAFYHIPPVDQREIKTWLYVMSNLAVFTTQGKPLIHTSEHTVPTTSFTTYIFYLNTSKSFHTLNKCLKISVAFFCFPCSEISLHMFSLKF